MSLFQNLGILVWNKSQLEINFQAPFSIFPTSQNDFNDRLHINRKGFVIL